MSQIQQFELKKIEANNSFYSSVHFQNNTCVNKMFNLMRIVEKVGYLLRQVLHG